MASIDTAKFKLAVTIGDEEYRAVSCKAGRETGAKHLQYARLWESGRLVQHFDFLELILENDQGKQVFGLPRVILPSVEQIDEA